MRGCSHSPRPHRICEHLLFPEPPNEGNEDSLGYRLIFQGPEWTTLCSPCAKGEAADAPGLKDAAAPVLAECCDACRRPYLNTDTFGAFDGFGGTKPEPRERDAGYSLVIESVDIRGALRDRVLAMAPVAQSGRARWVLWTEARRLVTVELPSGEILSQSAPLSVERLPEIVEDPERDLLTPYVSLQVSANGRFAVLLLEKTRHGVLVETATGAALAMLDRGDYHTEVCKWPAAFVQRRGRTLLVHAIAWNRIGVMDAETATAVTPDETEEEGHDYFHGPLAVSPGGKWIASGGWAWQPVGIVRVFRLDLWLDGKRARDDVSDRTLNQTGYWWNGYNLWLDDESLLVAGVGDDDQRMVDGGLVHRMGQDSPAAFWPGLPLAPLFHDRAGGFVYSGGKSTAVWDVATGDRIAHAPELVTTGFHPSARHTAGLVDPEGRFTLGFLQRR